MSKNERYDSAPIICLFLYALVSYVTALWWLTLPLFLYGAKTFFTLSKQAHFFLMIVWGLCAAFITFFPCLWMGVQCSRGLGAAALFDTLLMIHGTVIFVCAAVCARSIKKYVDNAYVQLLAFVALTVCMWWFIDTHFFWWVAPGYGYMLANPILPLCAQGWCRAVVPHIASYGLLGLMVLGAGVVVQWLYHSKKDGRAILFALCVGLCVGVLLVFYPQYHRPRIADRIVALQGDVAEEKSFLQSLCLIKLCVDCCSDCDLVVGPESLLSFPLNEAASACTVFEDGCPVVLFGAPCSTNVGRYNSAYCVHQGRITYRYDKITLLPLFERCITACWFLKGLQGLFNPRGKCDYLPGRQSSAAPETALFLDGVRYHVRICLCSDLFCGNVTPPSEPSLVVALVNDEWFFGSCMADRMLWFAALWAARHRTPVVYVGYRHASFIEGSGRQWPLARVGKLA